MLSEFGAYHQVDDVPRCCRHARMQTQTAHYTVEPFGASVMSHPNTSYVLENYVGFEGIDAEPYLDVENAQSDGTGNIHTVR